MSTTWYVPIPKNSRNAVSAICKMTGWKKCESGDETDVLTDGGFYIHCYKKPITIVKHGKYAVLERFGGNWPTEDALRQIRGTVTDEEPGVLNCDNCGGYVLGDEIYITKNESIVCRTCYKKSK